MESESEKTPSGTPAVVQVIRGQMEHKWKEHPQLIPTFFRVDRRTRAQARSAKGEWYLPRSSRWKKVPTVVKTADKLRTSVLNILNGILKHFNLEEKREFIDTSAVKLDTPRNLRSSPSILLIRRADGSPDPLGYYWGLSCIEVISHAEDSQKAHEQLALHTSEFFASQDNRRFAFGLVITQRSLELFMFDRSGGVQSETLDYHKKWGEFCAIISGISSTSEGLLGFDLTISMQNGRTCIRTGESEEGAVYMVQEKLYHSTKMVGRGTVCWLVRPNDDEGHIVIKDAWVPNSLEKGKQLEGVLLRRARTKGVIKGISRLRHFEVVKHGEAYDTVLENRRMHPPRLEAFETELKHIRLVLSTYGKPLEHFSDRLELVTAFHDVVQAHRDLFFNAKILHRDISLSNLLINRDGQEGDRGVLIDFDLAIRVDAVSRNPPMRIGTLPYMSRNILKEEEPHSHFDDLESFYYALCFIVTGCSGPGIDPSNRIKALPEEFVNWHAQSKWDFLMIAQDKNVHFISGFHVGIRPWFGPHITKLVKGLHTFFAKEALAGVAQLANAPDSETDSHAGSWEPPPLPPRDPAADYETYLGHIRTALAALRAESEPLAPVGPLPTGSQPPVRRDHDHVDVALGKRPREETEHGRSFNGSAGSKRGKADVEGRPRRSKTNYGPSGRPAHPKNPRQ